MVRFRFVAISMLAVLGLVGPVATRSSGYPRSEGGADEIAAKQKQEREDKEKAEAEKNKTPTTPTTAKTADCAEISKTLESTDAALDTVKAASEVFKTDGATVKQKVDTATPTLEKYTSNYINCVNDPALQEQLTGELLQVKTQMTAAARKMETAMNAVPKAVQEAEGPKAAIAKYKALADKVNIEIDSMTYFGWNPLACGGKFWHHPLDTALVTQWLIGVGETMQALSDAAKATIDAGNGDIGDLLSNDKYALCQEKMQDFYEKKGGKYEEFVVKKGDKNKLSRKARLKEMDSEDYLIKNRLDEKLEKVTIQSGDSLWNIAKGMLEQSKRNNANINKMMNKLITALKKEKGDKTNPSKLASGTTIDLDKILAEKDA